MNARHLFFAASLALLASLRLSAFAVDVDHSAFDAILKATVKDERVDYDAVKANHLPALTAYLDALAKVDPATLQPKEQLATYINLYNASMINAIVGRLKPGYSPSENNY